MAALAVWGQRLPCKQYMLTRFFIINTLKDAQMAKIEAFNQSISKFMGESTYVFGIILDVNIFFYI